MHAYIFKLSDWVILEIQQILNIYTTNNVKVSTPLFFFKSNLNLEMNKMDYIWTRVDYFSSGIAYSLLLGENTIQIHPSIIVTNE